MVFRKNTIILSVLLLTLFVVPASSQSTVGKESVALRANLLRWATLTPDIGIEHTMSDRWSVMLGGSWTHLSWDNKARHYGLWEAAGELRRYLGDARRAYLGGQIKIGQYNYKFSTTGNQGDICGLGLTGGYKLPLGSSPFALDFTLGLGYLHVEYEKYGVDTGIRVKSRKGEKGYWGVTNVGVVLSYDLKL